MAIIPAGAGNLHLLRRGRNAGLLQRISGSPAFLNMAMQMMRFASPTLIWRIKQ
jgi:hypothetical protein